MHSFLGVPIILRGVAYGNLYLTEKEDGGDFTDDDEELLARFAAQAAVAIENARLYESATCWLRQLELTEVGNALASELDLPRLLGLIADGCASSSTRALPIMLPEGDALRVAAASGDVDEDTIGMRFPLRTTKSARVLQRRRAERVDSLLDDPESNPELARRLRARAGLYVPLVHHDCASACWRPMTSAGQTDVSATTTSGSRRRSRRGRPRPSTCPSA